MYVGGTDNRDWEACETRLTPRTSAQRSTHWILTGRAEARNKKLEHEALTNEQELQSLRARNTTLEEQLEEAEKKLDARKSAADDEETLRRQNEALQRKVTTLEEELENTEAQIREMSEKHRETDIKAENLERQVTRLEEERDEWEKKHEDLAKEHSKSKAELDELVLQLEAL